MRSPSFLRAALFGATCLAASLGAAGCRDSKSAGCASTNDCPAGHICLSAACQQLCQGDSNCPRGYVCDAAQEVCVAGSRGAPEISAIQGNGALACQDQNDTTVRCIRDGFIVVGSNLAGATFELVGPDGLQATYPLSVMAGATGVEVELKPVLPSGQSDLTPGTYLLAAYNQSGSTQQSVQLLRGEAGPDADGNALIGRINASGVTSTIGADRIDVARVHTYDNTTSAQTSAGGAGRARVRVNGSADGSVKSVAVDNTRLQELCADGDGCTLSLGATRFRDLADPTYIIEAPMHGGPCRFFLDAATGSWSLSQYCVAIYGLYAYDSGSSQWQFERPYQIYEYSNVYGLDGSGGGIDPDGGALIVLGFKGACYLAESAPNPSSTAGEFTADSSVGLHLVASGSSWESASIYPTSWPGNDGNRACELIIED